LAYFAANLSELAMRSEASVEINRPIDEVFDFTNDHVVEWSLTVVEDTVIDDTPDRVGTTFKCVTESRGKRLEFQGEVTRWERPHVSAINLVGDSFDIEAAYFFETTPDGTRVTQKAVISPKGFLKVVFFLCGWMMGQAGCDEARKELEKLKRVLEERDAVTEE
jgi:uncharacterized membrane protein